MEYGEVTALRRSARLVYDAGQSTFSFLNVLIVAILALTVVMGLVYGFSGN